MPRKKYISVLTVIFILLQYFSPLVGLIPVQATGNSNVCPEGNGWSDHVGPGVDGNVEYTAPTGYVVDSVCIKGGSEGSSNNGYLKFFTEDDWYKVTYKEKVGEGRHKEEVEFTKNCVGASGIEGTTAKAMHGDAKESKCAAISHASFKLARVQGAELVCTPGVNLLKNADFETPVVTTATNWDIVPSGTTGLEWKVEWQSIDTLFEGQNRPEIANLELHKGVNGWLPQTGSQYAELDSDWFGPGNPLNNEPASVKISQEIATIPNYEYKVEYHFSPRPGTPDTDNKLVSAWAGNTLETHIATGGANTSWTKHTETIEATSEKAILSFMDDGNPNSLGTFLDNVSVECVGPVVETTTIPTNTPTPSLTPTPEVCSEGPTWVSGVLEGTDQGTEKDGSSILAERSNPENTLGEADGKFFSLGLGGVLMVEFEYPVLNVEGKKDISVHEITNGRASYPEEKAKVEVSLDGDTYFELGTASNKANTTGDPSGQGGNGVSLFDLETVGLEAAKYLRITDTTNYGLHIASADGYDLDAIDATYGLCEDQEVPNFADVTVCKQDNQQNYLPGWNVQLLGELLETVEVEPDDKIGDPYTPNYSSELPEGDYVLMARGTYKYRGGTELLTDPAYSQRLESDGFVGPYIPWINVMDLTTTGALGVTVNDAPADWGYFSPANTYARGFENYTGEFKFTSFDNNITDNEGSMYVDIYEGYAGFTEEDGCITFENVPYGDYMTNEILMKDWENVSGQATEVVVENETETFTLVNRPVSEPAKLLATKVVCSEEQYLPNNQQGPIDADTAAEWVAQSGGQCKIEEDWDFQWGPAGSGSFGDFQENTTEMGDPWTTFSSGVEVELPELGSVGGRVELREVFPDESYVPFSNDGSVSAEFYCTGDTANYDNWEWLSGYEEDNTYYCVAFNAVKMGAIEGMKFEDANANGERDDEEMGIPNWQIVLKPETLEPIYDLDLPANSPTGVNTGVLSSSKYYLVEVEGTYSYSGVTKLADAEYYSTDNWSNSADFADNLGRDVRTLDVVIDDQNIEWGSSNSAHLYKTVIKGNDAVANLRIFDEDNDPNPPSWYNDNAGTLEVRVYDVSNYRVETDEDGEYSQEVENGEYQVVEINQPGWIQTAPSPSYCHLTVENGSTETCEFGNTRMGSIDGYKLEDTNGDGTLTRQDARLEGWEINLWTGDEEGPISKIQTKTTDENGYYKFDNLLPGIYWLSETQKEGWTQTAGDEEQGPLVIQVGTELHGNNFGNFELGRVEGYKWDDMNANGMMDEDRAALLSGWKVTLEMLEEDEENGYKIMNALPYKMTDEKGAFEFDGLLPGEYKLCEEMQDGWMQTYPLKQNEISVAFSDDYDTECHYIEIETSGQVLSNYNFGNFELGEVSGYKWDDDNGDGIKTYGELKMEGWTVELRMDTYDGTVVDTEETDTEGEYSFNNLMPGTYFLTEVNQAVTNGSWEQTYPVDPGYHTFVIDSSGDVFEDMNFGNNVIGDILAEKTTTNETFTPGQLVTYNIRVVNKGTETAHGVEIWDNLPVGMQYYDSSPNGQYTPANNRVTWTKESLDVNEEWTAQIRLLVPADSTATSIINEVRALRSCQLVNDFTTTLVPSIVEVPEPVIEFCEDDPTPEDNIDSVSLNRAQVAGANITDDEESTGNIRGIATSALGKVLGASNSLSDTGRNMSTALILGTSLISAIFILNKNTFRRNIY